MESVTTTEKTEFYYNDGLNSLKFWLMPFICLASFPVVGRFMTYVSRLSLFASIAFFILCGFSAAAGEKEEKNLHGRVLKRTALCFIILFAVFLILNFIYFFIITFQYRDWKNWDYNTWKNVPSSFSYTFLQIRSKLQIDPSVWMGVRKELLNTLKFMVPSKRELFNFVFLCIWPYRVGQTIWFLQALVYGRIILWLMNKWKLMRFYKILMILTILAMILFGEFAGLIRFNFHGYTCIPGNGITRALPYMLLGRFLYEKKEKILALPPLFYAGGFLFGIAAAVGEILILSKTGYLVYSGHIIGYGIMAFCACCFFLKQQTLKKSFSAMHGRNYSRRIYALSQPVGYAILLLTGIFLPSFYDMVSIFAAAITYIICLIIAFFVGMHSFMKYDDHVK